MAASTPPKNIIIVGGSLAGLMTGLALKNLGHIIKIYERSPTSLLHDQGAGIVFGPEAQEFFSTHVPLSRSLYVPSHLRQTLRRDGSVLNREEKGQKMVSWDLLYFCLRGVFDGVESGYFDVEELRKKEGEDKGKGEYVYGRKVVGVKDLGDEVEVSFENEDGSPGTEKADMVIAADGPSSTVRKLVLPEVERTYAGYVAWRGTVLESEASEIVKESFVDKFTFFHSQGTQILSYLIPGKDGTIEKGKRLVNWVWYCNYAPSSPAYKTLMTDTTSHTHHTTMPASKLQPHLWAAQKAHARKVLPTAFSSLVCSTKLPFIQAITDVLSPEISFFDGKLLLVGDAVAGFRPHTAASTSQAAYHALLVERFMGGTLGWGKMVGEMVDYAGGMCAAGRKMGDRSQFGGEGVNMKEIATSGRIQIDD